MSIEPQDELNEVLNEPQEEAVQEVAQEEAPQEPQQEVVQEEPKPEKKKLTFEERQAQIAKQIKEKHEVQRAIEAEKLALQREREELEKIRRQYTPKEDLPPDPNNYGEDYAKYIDDLAEWKAQKAIKAKQQELTIAQQEAKQREEAERLARDWEAKTQIRLQKDPSFVEKENLVVMILQQNPNKLMYESIMDSDLNVDIVDYLGANPEECLRIASLRGTRASAEIGRIEERIQGRKSQAVTKAPAPINTVKSSGVTGARNIANIDDFAEYSRLMNKQLYG